MVKRKGVNFTDTLVKIQATMTTVENERDDLLEQLKEAQQEIADLKQKLQDVNGNESEIKNLRSINDRLTVQLNMAKRQNKDVMKGKLSEIEKILMS